MRGPVVSIVGPTASGKSELAEEVALRLGSSVISVDAMQVYRGMDIGTAKTNVENRRCELEMVDICDISEEYSVQKYQIDARSCADKILDNGVTPVLCGGTGLYLNAVIDKMFFPEGSLESSSRIKYQSILEAEGAEHLHALLEQRDPESAQLIHPNNARRTIRALELLDEGVSYAKHHEGLNAREPYYDARIWGISLDRKTLYERIEARVDAMMASGLLDEVRGLSDALRASSTARQAIGYKEMLDYLDGDVELDEAVEQVKARTRRYAKRQLSWFGRDGRVRWLDSSLGLDAMADSIVADVQPGEPS